MPDASPAAEKLPLSTISIKTRAAVIRSIRAISIAGAQ